MPKSTFRFDQQLATSLNAMLEAGVVPFLAGPPGIGKTSFIENLAYKTHTKCFTLQANQLADRADLTGARLVPDEASGTYKQQFFPHAVIMDAVNYAASHPAERPLLNIDELNRTSSDITSALLSLITARRMGNVKLPDNLLIIGSGNDHGNVTAMDSASITRFAIISVRPDYPTFLAVNPDLNAFVKQTLEKDPEAYLFCKGGLTLDEESDATMDVEDLLDEENEMVQFTTPRTITAVSHVLNNLTTDELTQLMCATAPGKEGAEPQSALEALLISIVGDTPFMRDLNLTIVSNLNNAQANQMAITVPCPRTWAALTAATDQDSLDDAVDALSTEDVAGCFVYALYDKTDRASIIKAIVRRVDELLEQPGATLGQIMSSDDWSTIFNLTAQKKLNPANVETFAGTDSKFWEIAKAVFPQS